MLSKNHNKWEKIKSEPDANRAISQVIDLADESFGNRELDIENICNMVNNINKALLGNGDPTNSIIARLTRIEENYSRMNDNINSIQKLLIGDISSRKDSIAENLENMNDRIERLERSMLNINKVIWVAVAAIVGEIVLAILSIL